MYILDGNLLKCNPLQATVANPHRAATECAETPFGGVTTGPLYFLLKGRPTPRIWIRAKDHGGT